MKKREYTPARRAAAERYHKKAYDKITFRVRKDALLSRAKIQELAKKAGQSMNEYIMQSIEARAEREDK